jgi:general secretion pathway protein A
LGKRVVVVIDEAQNLDDSVLELVRMLSNFENSRDKLIQIILAGQPQLADNIGSPELLQLRQRISIFARLNSFTPEETALYIQHRLRVAGYNSDMPMFTKDALALITLCSEGIPRNINNLCFNALSLGCALQQKPIDRDIVRQVIADLDFGPWRKRASLPLKPEEKATPVKILEFSTVANTPSRFAGWLPKVAVAAVVLLAIGGALFESQRWLGRPAASQPAPTAVVKQEPMPSVQPAAPSAGQPDTAAASPALSPALPDPVAAPHERPTTIPAVTPTLIADETSPTTSDSVGIVRVSAGQTLLGICIERFGSCTSELLQQIHELNPSLNNPDHIESGQNIRIPVLAAQASRGEQPRKSPSIDTGTHE